MRDVSYDRLKRIYKKLLSERERSYQLSSYRRLARPEQLPPEGDWFCWLILAGRGFGKTWTGANWVVEISQRPQFKRILLGGRDRDNILGDMVYGVSGIYSVCPNDYKPVHKRDAQTERLEFPSGAVAYIRSPKNKEKIRGMNLNAAWIDEAAVLPDAYLGLYEDTYMANVLYALRAGKSNRLVVTTTPKPVKLLSDLMRLPKTVVTRGSTYDNIENLSNSYIENVVYQYENTRLGKQEIYAVLEEDNPSGWSKHWIHRGQYSKLDRVVVGLDPATSVREQRSQTGIVVVGSGDGLYWVLEDLSVKGSPSEWATRVVDAWIRWDADCVVVERNAGGDLIVSVLKSVHPGVPVETVWASWSKRARADPVRLMYERGLVYHAGELPELEEQMYRFPVGGTDRVDALVWAILYLSDYTSSKSQYLMPDQIKLWEGSV